MTFFKGYKPQYVWFRKRAVCPVCKNTGWLDWAEDKCIPCPKGCDNSE